MSVMTSEDPSDIVLKHIGFTGTQIGQTPQQLLTVERILATVCGWFHHGDCTGADEQSHAIARRHGKLTIIIHPPIIASKRAFCQGDVILDPKDYIARNHDIVDASIGLITTPKSFVEELRSGTWATVRYARKQHKKIVIVFPDGSWRKEET